MNSPLADTTREIAQKWIPWRVQFLAKSLMNADDMDAAARFLLRRDLPYDFATRLTYMKDIYRASYGIDCAHTQSEIIECATALLSIPQNVEGCFVEAGCYKGGSTAKFSRAADIAGRKMVVFDSFEGLPENNEDHGTTIRGDTATFGKGFYRGGLEEVRHNVTEYGAIAPCTFIKGWFEETMPRFAEPIAIAYLDVDLVSSTKACLKHLYPLLQPGGAIFSQDAHLPLIISLLNNDRFWEDEVGYPKPCIEKLGSRKLVKIPKEAHQV